MKVFDHFFVGNRWVPATGSGGADLINPATEQVSGRVRYCSEADVNRAVASAKKGFAVWSTSTAAVRKAALVALQAALERRADDFIEALAEDIGAPLSISKLLHVPMPQSNLGFMIAGMDQIVWEEPVGNSLVVRDPVGVIAGVTPWNAPIHQIAAKVGGAIGAGCSFVLKASHLTPTVAKLFFDAIADCGLPSGVINMVWGGREIGESLTTHPDIDMISFTGSDGVGKQVMAAAAGTLKRLSLELGGKSAALVLDDADLEVAIPFVVRQSMANSGQTCVCQSRLLVPHSLLERAERLAVNFASQLKIGNPLDETTRIGPVATHDQFERVNRFIEIAQSEGGRLIFGGAGRPPGIDTGYYIRPTIFSDIRPAMTIAQQEVFGPVLAIMPYEDEEEGVRIANGTLYGLSGAVWSGDGQRAQRVARRLRTGQIVINGAPQNLAAPFGGYGHSGFGRENGRFGIEEYLELKAIQGAAL